MKKIGIFAILIAVYGCGEPDVSKSKPCTQAKNQVSVYTNSLKSLNELYSDDINSTEAKRRISKMQGRIDSAKILVNMSCKEKS